MIQFDKLPTDKPSQNASIVAGRHLVKITGAKILKAASSGNEYLSVRFETKDKQSMLEGFHTGDKPFLQYKIGRLLRACNIKLEGEGTLNDIAKLLPNKKAIIDVEINDRGYAGLDFSGNKEGIYKSDEFVTDEIEVDEDIKEAVATEDDDF